MASVNGIVANEKSMSGVVESPIGDVIDCTLLIADSVESQNIYAQDGLVDCSLFNNDFATITLGNDATNLINLGAFQFLVDTIRHFNSTLNLYLFPTTTGIINFATSASQIVFGNSTALVSSKVPTSGNHLTNKTYVDSVAGGGVSLNDPNVWTDINTFEDGIECESYYTEGLNTSRDMNIYPNLTNSGGKLTLGNFSGGRYVRLAPTSVELVSTTNVEIEADADLNISTLIPAGRASLYSPAKTIIGNNLAESSTANTFSLITKLIGKDITIQGKSTSGSTSITNLATNIINTATDIINTATIGFAMVARYITFNSATGGSSQIDLNFCTYTPDPSVVTSAIYASGGTSSSLSGTINPSCNTFTVSAPTLNLGNGNGVVDINGTNINLDSTNTYLNSYMYINTPNTSAIFLNLASGSYPIFANIPMITFAATATTMTFSNITMGMTYYYAYTRTTAATITLSDTVARDGNYVYIINQANANVVISCASARIFGNSVTRGGVTSKTLTPNTNCKITCYMNLGGRMGNSTLTFGYFIQMMT
jgi:hypothetical protein